MYSYNTTIEAKLRQDLDRFKGKYGDKLVIPAEPVVDITDCFIPRGFRRMADNKLFTVDAYVVRGSAFGKKYQQEGGHMKFDQDGGEYLWEMNPLHFSVLSCLCVYPVHNTTILEVYDILRHRKPSDRFQGWLGYQVAKSVNRIKRTFKDFDPEKDSAFIFADEENSCEMRMKLFGMWFSQLIHSGSGVLDEMSQEEAKLLSQYYDTLEGLMFEDAILNSYKPGTKHHTKESSHFLYNKLKNAARLLKNQPT